ncbi:hypothetical protein LSTR_LSTR002654 [Laodelphax striatellus]|uniref:FAM69 protein-kinase domain-containing protein n=1 Tax=Laodelphax striatellus TaxID=195883 RepID=A0A482X5Q5_LAOST|nr:hypothetical protein LSTR_LSTR002654 [Laodelphax striatellus]
MFLYLKDKSIFLLSIIFLLTLIYHKDVREILKVNKCPLCFGVRRCSDFDTGKFSIWNSSIFLKTIIFIKYTFGLSFVIFCKLNDQNVVIKQFDYCYDPDESSILNSSAGEDELKITIIKDLKSFLDIPFNSTLSPNIRLCPTTDKLEILLESIDSFGNNDIDLLQNVRYMIHTDPEPFIQQILKAEDGWPIPKYFGGCGTSNVAEYCGKMLTQCVNYDWDSRKQIARQLLDSALNFTFNHPHFAFYFSDITPDNIAVTATGQVRFIDLDNVIIVEKNTTADLPSWTELHSSEDIECDNCFAFSSDDICSHHYSDHNVYAVCREILNPQSHLIDGGLLHSTPLVFFEKHPNFKEILEQCVSPRTLDRFYYAKKLMEILS